MTTEQERAPTLGEKMMNYIALQKKGVTISEMENSLGVSRMKIGYVAKKLFEEGKLDREKNLYFPKNMSKMLNLNPEL